MSLRSREGNEKVDVGHAGLSTIQYKNVDGLQIRYATSQSKGDPILLLGTWPESILAYLPTWEAFTAIGSVVAVDLPGFGRSESRPGIISPEPMGDFLPLILEAFGLQRPHVVGPDIGTPTLLYAALKHPGIFKSMIIGGGATDIVRIGDILKELVNASSLDSYKSMTGAEFVKGAVANIKKYKLPDFALQDYLASYEGERFLESVQFVRNYPQALPRISERLSEIKVPCQIIVGRNDPYVLVSNAERLRRGLSRSKLDVLDCGHFAWEDCALEYGQLASEWITGGYSNL